MAEAISVAFFKLLMVAISFYGYHSYARPAPLIKRRGTPVSNAHVVSDLPVTQKTGWVVRIIISHKPRLDAPSILDSILDAMADRVALKIASRMTPPDRCLQNARAAGLPLGIAADHPQHDESWGSPGARGVKRAVKYDVHDLDIWMPASWRIADQAAKQR
jgi:hypothetical protein